MSQKVSCKQNEIGKIVFQQLILEEKKLITYIIYMNFYLHTLHS